ncbi:hypothetical protein MUK42_33303 [Musa troglodytarum]|uniref:Uncharacterized protein n=1 Tax=Musa troglodytarum TaxID=320322 RepID=A0A9E7IBI9_9LILI|nr:hypothetical protein MUK42_33303 [Musa troglodytarum]
MRYITRLVNAHKFYKMLLLILLFLVQSLLGVLCAVIQKLFSFRYGLLVLDGAQNSSSWIAWLVCCIHIFVKVALTCHLFYPWYHVKKVPI